MKTPELWDAIHAERRALVETWQGFTAEQWAAPSWCEGWTIQQVAGHVVAAAEQTIGGFYLQFAAAGFNFTRYAARGADTIGAAGPEALIERLAARTTTTNHPPAPVLAMLGEVVVHGEDQRRPLGLTHVVDPETLVTLAEGWKSSNLLIGVKRRITGLRLESTDTPWSTGSGPLITGPLQSLVLAMTGRRAAQVDLEGPGLEILATR